MKKYIVWYYIVTTSTALPSISNPDACKSATTKVPGYSGYSRDSAVRDHRAFLGRNVTTVAKFIDSTRSK